MPEGSRRVSSHPSCIPIALTAPEALVAATHNDQLTPSAAKHPAISVCSLAPVRRLSSLLPALCIRHPPASATLSPWHPPVQKKNLPRPPGHRLLLTMPLPRTRPKTGRPSESQSLFPRFRRPLWAAPSPSPPHTLFLSLSSVRCLPRIRISFLLSWPPCSRPCCTSHRHHSTILSMSLRLTRAAKTKADPPSLDHRRQSQSQLSLLCPATSPSALTCPPCPQAATRAEPARSGALERTRTIRRHHASIASHSASLAPMITNPKREGRQTCEYTPLHGGLRGECNVGRKGLMSSTCAAI